MSKVMGRGWVMDVSHVEGEGVGEGGVEDRQPCLR